MRVKVGLCVLFLAFGGLLTPPGGRAVAADLLGLYVGGAFGQGDVTEHVANPFLPNPFISNVSLPTASTFNADHAAFKVMLGLRPLPWVGAEVSYLDFGHPTGTLFGAPASTSMRGESAFAVLYLPVPVIDVFAKAGAARLQSTITGFAPTGIPVFICAINVPCGSGPVREDRTNTHFAAGGGLQFKIAAFAVRAEYERFDFAGEAPHLLSLGATWSF